MEIQNAASAEETYPWPAPSTPWVMTQTWRKLLFAHWPLAPEAVRPLLPPGLPLDTYDGQAWLGIVPFRMESVRFRGIPALPTTERFAELNVRTYVTLEGKPGVYFFSLDAASLLAVLGARAIFALPYFHARFSIADTADGIAYRSDRVDGATAQPSHATHAALELRYRPTGPVQFAQPGSLDDWLTARYCLYTQRAGHLLRGEIRHPLWPLQPATAEIMHNSMTAPVNIQLPAMAPRLLYSERIEVHVWPLYRVTATR